jgi:hypothetical protein
MPIQVDCGSELLEFLYSAVGDLTLWNEFLARVNDHLDAQRTAFLSIDPDSQRSSVHLYTGWPSDAVRQYEAYYGVGPRRDRPTHPHHDSYGALTLEVYIWQDECCATEPVSALDFEASWKGISGSTCSARRKAEV